MNIILFYFIIIIILFYSFCTNYINRLQFEGNLKSRLLSYISAMVAFGNANVSSVDITCNRYFDDFFSSFFPFHFISFLFVYSLLPDILN